MGGMLDMKRHMVIPQDTTDEHFRRHTKDLIDSARKEIIVIAGELGAYSFHDLRQAAEAATERGIKIRIYGSSPGRDIVNRLVRHGCEVYIGKEKPYDHYMLVDRKSYIISKKGESKACETMIGTRLGYKYLNDKSGAKEIVNLFNRLTKGLDKEKIRGEDPFVLALKSPLDWGVQTNASKIHEEFG